MAQVERNNQTRENNGAGVAVEKRLAHAPDSPDALSLKFPKNRL